MEKVFQHKDVARITYKPYRPGLKHKKDWWCVAEVNGDIDAYYRWFVLKRYGLKLHKPAWGAHISIIRGEKPFQDKMDLWGKYEGLEVQFEYSCNIRQSGDTTGWDRPDCFWFVDIKSDFLIDIRKEMNFPYNYGLHLTIGRMQ